MLSPGEESIPGSVAARPEPSASAEALLLARARAGDNAAFDELAGRYSTRLRRILFRITRDCEAALDAVQEALLRAWRNVGRFKGDSRFFTWLTRIGINEAYRGMRSPVEREVGLEQTEVELLRSPLSTPEESVQSRDLLAAIARGIASLPDEYREAVRLRDVNGLDTREAAAALGIGERALKSRLHRGRMALRAQLGDQLSDGVA